MGKKGDLLREAKKQRATYVFTAEQLQEHDRQVLLNHVELLEAKVGPKVEAEMQRREEEAKAVIQKEWAERAKEFQSGTPEDNMMAMLQYLLSVSSRVLIEKFHWSAIPKDGKYDRRNRTMRFAECLISEIEKISEDDSMDIRQYAEDTYNLYGVRFKTVQGDNGG